MPRGPMPATTGCFMPAERPLHLYETCAGSTAVPLAVLGGTAASNCNCALGGWPATWKRSAVA